MVTLGFGFTGYLLPWDQRAYWATVVGTEIAGGVPVVGEPLLLLLRGRHGRHRGHDEPVLRDPRAGPAARARRAPRGASAARPPARAGEPEAAGAASRRRPKQRPRSSAPFYPNYILDELVAWYVLLAILVVLASMFPAGLEQQANPLETPAHIKPEWYYLGVYQLLKLVPIKVVGILIPIVGIALLVVWPFLDRSPEVLARRRKVVVGVATLVLVGLVVLTVVGYVGADARRASPPAPARYGAAWWGSPGSALALGASGESPQPGRAADGRVPSPVSDRRPTPSGSGAGCSSPRCQRISVRSSRRPPVPAPIAHPDGGGANGCSTATARSNDEAGRRSPRTGRAAPTTRPASPAPTATGGIPGPTRSRRRWILRSASSGRRTGNSPSGCAAAATRTWSGWGPLAWPPTSTRSTGPASTASAC